MALAAFKNGRIPVLVATDIAARGIDVNELGHVVNFDVPEQTEDYIHRIGRTGRAEAIGDAFTFMAPDEVRDLAAIERVVGRTLPRITVPDFDYHARTASLEVPMKQRIAEIRARKAQERARRDAKLRGSYGGGGGQAQRGGGGQPQRSGGGQPQRPQHGGPHSPAGANRGRRSFRPGRRRGPG
jgi:ATP-dependent RNA helicase RhlE